MSCIGALYLAGSSPGATRERHAFEQATASEADTLYRDRDDLSKAARAAEIWAARVARGGDYEAAWKLARVRYWLGTHVAEGERRATLEAGVTAGTAAAALQPDRPEGHFWMAANMGALAESFGLRQGLKYRGRIKNALERVLRIDAAWQQGSADRALGRWYFKVPGLFGGSRQKAEAHLRRSLTYNPHSTASLVFLAEVLLADRRRDDAVALLQRAIDAPIDPAWAPEDREFKARAAEMLRERSRVVLVEPFP